MKIRRWSINERPLSSTTLKHIKICKVCGGFQYKCHIYGHIKGVTTRDKN